MSRRSVLLFGSVAALVLLLTFGCSLLPREDTGASAGGFIKLQIQAPASKGIAVTEFDVTGLSIQVRDPEGEVLQTIDWVAVQGPQNYLVPVKQLGQHQIEVTHFGEREGEAVQAMESASFNIQAMKITVIDIVPGGIGLIRVTPGGSIVTTLAGMPGAAGSDDGTGAAARFWFPVGVTTDGANLFVADEGNSTIRKIVIATRVVTTLAGMPGVIGSDDGVGAEARFNCPEGITTDGSNLYVMDWADHTIRKVVIATGMVTTMAGAAGVAGSDDGTGTEARFNSPGGITTDGANLYIADSGNCTIRKVVIATGMVTTMAGAAGVAGSDDGTGAEARFGGPMGITTDGADLYVTDNHTIRKIVIATGVVTTIAGTAGVSGSDDGIGAEARFNAPMGITTDGASLYVADKLNRTIRKVVIPTGVVTTIAGMAGVIGSDDGIGAAARFSRPQHITTDGASLYVADARNNTIRVVTK
jgi:hypothetical protein